MFGFSLIMPCVTFILGVCHTRFWWGL